MVAIHLWKARGDYVLEDQLYIYYNLQSKYLLELQVYFSICINSICNYNKKYIKSNISTIKSKFQNRLLYYPSTFCSWSAQNSETSHCSCCKYPLHLFFLPPYHSKLVGRSSPFRRKATFDTTSSIQRIQNQISFNSR